MDESQSAAGGSGVRLKRQRKEIKRKIRTEKLPRLCTRKTELGMKRKEKDEQMSLK